MKGVSFFLHWDRYSLNDARLLAYWHRSDPRPSRRYVGHRCEQCDIVSYEINFASRIAALAVLLGLSVGPGLALADQCVTGHLQRQPFSEQDISC